MIEPEIARRCPTCGASIREVALFCPQCGNAQPPRQGHSSVESENSAVNTAPLEAEEAAPRKDFSDTIAIDRFDNKPSAADELRSMSDTMVIERPDGPATSEVRPGVREAMGTRIHRATTLARDVEGDVINRVQKVREVSNVVLDEAGNDPNLRFLLVAVIVFVLFLVIVLLNKLIP
jgi:predicted RNA-binding Zn-ribbon protein involved in translation (DUF1610 family)